MQNVDMKVEGKKLVITVDLDKTFGTSASGKSITVATTGGNKSVPGMKEDQMDGNETKIKDITRGGDPCGTSLLGEIVASYKKLVDLLGEPHVKLTSKGRGSDGKCSTEWYLTCDGRTFTLYDYKETTLYHGATSCAPTPEEFRELPKYSWHIGGHGCIEPFLNLLETAIKE